MAGYVIADVEVHDQDAYAEYRKIVGASIEKFGGKFLVRGGDHEVVEGDWNPHRVVVLEFDSVARVKEWYASAEYAPALAIRLKATTSKSIVVEGA
ncbi:MAG: DUF1330 domain-containing protein [SAR202 cluster bacterium]|jgi:uncharacterized protein (DUF1330 family)|nr:DUF1330 domain-containing protein [SAR202 cluster bacterium]MDP6301116.1 DUF1330 domain-containing protein [SAR202 cluster bacterium]MDP7104814.1 DUF1330 domain-containing protein [SAR202 cluster bacterium]MDP7225273.1 DUF1330 domain-containing protein [SAR202 cluster bacterium]MDP7413089.1 DUF1330 domain-containing protein [SAR202 cluster bacterium]|tara:strand:+ start:1674 stop:1961 length:288 start_codon:yes stop_codon:yes gene_type:complete